MAYFVDLEPCDYFQEIASTKLIAVGWLAAGKDFSIGVTAPDVFEKLKTLLNDPWQPFHAMGVHECEICQYEPTIGIRNLFVPSGQQLFVCPELILHYIAAHHYQPPANFSRAVMACPDTRSIEYKKLLLSSGGRGLVSKP